MIALICLTSMLGINSHAVTPDASKLNIPDESAEGRVCEECEARRILNDKFAGYSPAQRRKMAGGDEGKAEKPTGSGSSTGQ